MSAYHDWIIAKRRGRGLNMPRVRDDWQPPEERRPFNRCAIIDEMLHQAEQDLAYTTRWLADCDNPAYPLAVSNYEHFLDWRWDANDRYARALRLAAKLKAPVRNIPVQDSLF